MDPRTSATRVEPTPDGQRLRIVWGDGHISEFPPRDLRLACHCAACMEEMTGRPLLDPRTIPEDVYPREIKYVGRYALHFDWSDGHSTGIYPFELLRALCPCEECRLSSGA